MANKKTNKKAADKAENQEAKATEAATPDSPKKTSTARMPVFSR